MQIDVSNKVVVITGASRGIGKELALAFAKEKAKVVINYSHSNTEVSALFNNIKTFNSNCITVKADVRKEKDVEFLYNTTIDTYGKVDILINNAGICDDNYIGLMSKKQWQDVIDVNLTGVFLCCKYFSEAMIQQNNGKILVISSFKGQVGSVKQANYAASKAGTIGFAKSLAKELGDYDISVNVICPGFIVTDLNRKDCYKKEIAQNQSVMPIKAMMKNVVNFCVFLSSDSVSNISGRIFNLDSRISLE